MSKILVDTIDTRSGTSTLTVGSSNLTTLTKASGVNTNGLSISMAMCYRLTTDKSISAAAATVIDGNWEKADTDDAGHIGSDMSESSGVFTYPSTGIYLVQFSIQLQGPSQGATYAGGKILTTADNNNYSTAAINYNSIYHPNGYANAFMSFIHDVSSTGNDKVRFVGECEFACNIEGDSNANYTAVTFVRLGDT
jgi:hypothetical protein